MSKRSVTNKHVSRKSAGRSSPAPKPCSDIANVLPPLYDRWMRELLPGPIPREIDATCDDCAMWPGPGDRSPQENFFRLDTKCCTYVPALPNFLVGRILGDPDPSFEAGRKTIEARIAARLGVTPAGLYSPAVFSLLYQQGGGLVFGRSRRLRCPHYQEDTGGSCGIWPYRNGTCATWFCKHVRGAVGLRFWQALDQLLTITERSLGRWCALELRVDAEALHLLFPPGTDRVTAERVDGKQIDEAVDEAEYLGLWGNWVGREGEFYRSAAGLVDALTWHEAAEIAGCDVRLFASLAVDRYLDLVSPHRPEPLIVGPLRILAAGPRFTRVAAYSGLHPLDLPPELMAALPHFDGRPTSEVLRSIRKELGLRLSPGLIRKLCDFEILTPPR